MQRRCYISGLLLFFLFAYSNISSGQQKLDFPPGKKPLTHLPFNDDTAKLQFAIISDLWGGNRPGIFEDALVKLELLQPQFVISVGDLIDGKTHDTLLIDRQWKEFTAKVQSLSMPFFYVPGNHDIEYPVMEKEWRKRFGSPYYSFVYKNVLFLTVNTEDGGISGIKQQQVDYFKKVIAENPNVRWTFLFMHRPVWQGTGDRQEGYEKIEALLKGHNYTLFSGHHHTYLNVIKNGQKHFVLGTTGGGIELRGEKFGEYDHVTLVSLNTHSTPRIVNLKLDGIIKEDIVNEKTLPVTQALIDEAWMDVPRMVIPEQFVKTVYSEILFNNPTDYPLKITGALPRLPGYVVTPAIIDTVLRPGGKVTKSISITSANEGLVDIAKLPPVDIELQGSYDIRKTNYQLPSKKRLFLYWHHVLPQIYNAKKIAKDQFDNYDSAGFISLNEPELQNKWYWYGASDCLLQFRLLQDERNIYISSFIKDDELVPGKGQDYLYINLEDRNGAGAKIIIEPDVKGARIKVEGKSLLEENDLLLIAQVSADGQQKYIVQVPKDKIQKKDNTIRFNIGYRDQDNTPEIENATLSWQPAWGTPADYKNSGTFLLK